MQNPGKTQSAGLDRACRHICPSDLAYGIAKADEGRFTELPFEEQRCLGPLATKKRRSEFAMGRSAARQALNKMGIPAVPVGKGFRGQPLWPRDVVGSITHKNAYALAVVAGKNGHRAIGIDLETVSTDFETLRYHRRICHFSETVWVFENERLISLRLKLLFSAKEALFKAFSSIKFVHFDFKDIRLEWWKDRQGFSPELSKSMRRQLPALLEYDCRYFAAQDFIVTLVRII
jgi:4'-phosphopantetheinyl transferase EntD